MADEPRRTLTDGRQIYPGHRELRPDGQQQDQRDTSPALARTIIMVQKTKHDSSEYVGKKIIEAALDSDDNKLCIEFECGEKIAIWDDGQSCCEVRYVTTDDNPASLVGHRWRRVQSKEGPTTSDANGEHETIFVEVATDGGFITLVNHNEHNGYYGGFNLTITEGWNSE